jgi:diguanylate cyclase (GGDEF)-like protein
MLSPATLAAAAAGGLAAARAHVHGSSEQHDTGCTPGPFDELTGLLDHRGFRKRLEVEVSRAQRHGVPLTVALIDVDRFRVLNERIGHEEGDAVIAEVARLLCGVARGEDTIARLGADEFALLLPHADRHQALRALERTRQLVAATRFRHRERITVSAGLCDLMPGEGAKDLLRNAGSALYWSKGYGRDRCFIYDRDVVAALDADERSVELERSRALQGLQALARAVDAKDPSTRAHSERVAVLAAALAEAAGWNSVRITELREAALVHDVGKIGVPDAILLKPAALDAAEYEAVKLHAALGAQIVGDVLSEEQVRWIDCHHERPDGSGYPYGLSTSDIPEGAALLAMADAWDVMVTARPYSQPKERRQALQECRRLAGAQFDPDAVAALEELDRRGALIEPVVLESVA